MREGYDGVSWHSIYTGAGIGLLRRLLAIDIVL